MPPARGEGMRIRAETDRRLFVETLKSIMTLQEVKG
jgi:hypothetical protein